MWHQEYCVTGQMEKGQQRPFLYHLKYHITTVLSARKQHQQLQLPLELLLDN